MAQAVLKGQAVVAAPTSASVPANVNIRTRFAGVPCNSSDSYEQYLWRGFAFLKSLCFTQDRGFGALGYGEQHEVFKSFDSKKPNSPVSGDYNRNLKMTHVAADAQRVYKAFSSSGSDLNASMAIICNDAKTDARYLFPDGQRLQFAGEFSKPNYNTGDGTYLGYYDGAIVASQIIHPNPDAEGASVPESTLRERTWSGLAVQWTGNLLVATWAHNNQVLFYDKVRGTALGQLTVDSPASPAFAPNGDLWLISGGQAVRYVAGANLAYTKGEALPDTGQVLALSINYAGTELRVVSEDYQTVLAYALNGTRRKGFASPTVDNRSNSIVSNNSFLFRDRSGLGLTNADPHYDMPESALAEQPDGSFWVQDGGNARWKHYSAGYKYLGHIAYLASYLNQCVDAADASRFFADNLEFKLDLPRGFRTGDQSLLSKPSWQTVRNWILPAKYAPIRRVCTLTSKTGEKRTYAQVRDKTYDLVGNKEELIELPSVGLARPTGMLFDSFGNTTRGWVLYPTCLRMVETVPPNETDLAGVVNASQLARHNVWEQVFTGEFDGAGNPVFAQMVQQGTTLIPTSGPAINPNGFMQPQAPKLLGGVYTIFHPQQELLGYNHLGFLPQNATAYSKITLPNKRLGYADGQGNFPDIGSKSDFGGHTGLAAIAIENSKYVFAIYDGQGGEFSSVIWIYDNQGNFIQQLGFTSPIPEKENRQRAPIGYANNVLTASVAQAGNSYFVFLTDEVYHGGPVVQEIKVVSPAKSVIPLPPAPLPTPPAPPTPDRYAISATRNYPAANSYTYETDVIQGSSYAAVCVVRAETGYVDDPSMPPIIIEGRSLRNDAGNCVHVYMPNGREVIIRYLHLAGKSAADFINVTNDSRVTIYGCTATADGDQPIGTARGRFFYAYKPRKVNVYNNYLRNTAGGKVEYWSDNATDSDTLLWRYNRIDNICGGTGADYRQALQVQHITQRPGMQIAYNQVINTPGASRVEDNINLGESNGTSASPPRVHHNYIWGAYPANPTDGGFTGTGITTDAGSQGVSPANGPNGWLAEENWIVGCMNSCMNITAGRENKYRRNKIVVSGLLADGSRLNGVNNAVSMFRGQNYSTDQFDANEITDNDIFVNRASGENYYYENSLDPNAGDRYIGPNSKALVAGNTLNTYRDGATYKDEQDTLLAWQAYLSTNKIEVGVTTLAS